MSVAVQFRTYVMSPRLLRGRPHFKQFQNNFDYLQIPLKIAYIIKLKLYHYNYLYIQIKYEEN